MTKSSRSAMVVCTLLLILPDVASSASIPTTSGTSVVLSEDSTKFFQLLGDDPNGPEGALQYHIVSTPGHGTLVQQGTDPSRHKFTPEPDFFGTDSATFYVTDIEGLSSNVSTVTFSVAPVNDRAVAIPATFSLIDSQPTFQGQLRGTDIDSAPSTLEYFISSNPTKGTVSVVKSTGVFTYIPTNPSFRGGDSFSFKVKDEGPNRSDPAVVSMWITDDVVSLFGAADSFGTYGVVTGSGDFLLREPVDGWQFDPGATAYLPAIASDGTVFVANTNQTLNAFLIANCSMVITCFNPHEATCYDPETGFPANLVHVRVPNAGGDLFTPLDGEDSCAYLGPNQARGADVADVAVVVDSNGEERVAFVSSIGSLSEGTEGYPAFGTIRKSGGAWRLDEQSLRSAADLASSELALSRPPTLCTDGPGNAECGTLNEIEQLPRSGALVVGAYTEPGFLVLSPDGDVLSSYRVPPHGPSPCQPASAIDLLPRAVQVDPTSLVDDERFVVVYDSEGATDAQFVQEFSYQASSATVSPVSAIFVPFSTAQGQVECSGPKLGNEPGYDEDGNLWFATGGGVGSRAKLQVFLRDPISGKRRTETDCGYWTSDSPPEIRAFGFRCRSDLDLGRTQYVSATKLDWSAPWAMSVIDDPGADSVFVVGFEGEIERLGRVASTGASVFSSSAARVDLGLNRLGSPPAGFLTQYVVPHATLDVERGDLWVPVGARLNVSPPGCTFGCSFDVGESSANFLFGVDVDAVSEQWGRVISAEAPVATAVGTPVTISVAAVVPDGIDPARSGLYVYGDPLVDSAVRLPVGISGPAGCGPIIPCNYAAEIPGSLLTGGSPQVVWRLFLQSPGSTIGMTAVGRLEVD